MKVTRGGLATALGWQALRDPLVCLGLVGSLFLPAWAAAPAVAVLLGVWIRNQVPRREVVVLLVAGLAAIGALSWELWTSRRADLRRPDDLAEIAVSYRAAWQRLDLAAERAARAIGEAPTSNGGRLAAFHDLEALVAEDGGARRALLLVDPDGLPVAWAGSGLVHELAPDAVPQSGHVARGSFTGVTAFSVQPLTPDDRAWRVVAGESWETSSLPFVAASRRPGTRAWGLASPTERPPAGVVRLAPPGVPALWMDPPQAVAAPRLRTARFAWLCVGLGLLALALLRATSAALLTGAAVRRPSAGGRLLIPCAAGAAATALGAGAPPAAVGLLTAGAVVAVLGLGARPRGEASLLRAFGGGTAAAVVVAAIALGFQAAAGPIDLGTRLLVGAPGWCERLGLLGVAAGLLAISGGGRRTEGPGRDGVAWLGFAALLVAAAAVDLWPLAAACAVVGTCALAAWLRFEAAARTPTAIAVVCLGAALLSGTAWEASGREVLRRKLETVDLPALAPPSERELATAGKDLERFFASADVADLAATPVNALDPQDLAYALWRRSPLAREGALSALAVVGRDGSISTFSFGLPMRDRVEIDLSPARWAELRLPVWEEGLISGRAELDLDGRVWGTVRYWFLYRPGFRLSSGPVEDLAAGLLRGGPAALRPAERAVAPALYALYATDGRPLLTPWSEGTPRIEPATAASGTTTLRTPDGSAWVAMHRAADGIEAIYLPLLGPIEGLERVGTVALPALLVLALAVFAAILMSLPRPVFRQALGNLASSYPKRLIVVYTVLLLVPLLLLDVVLLRGLRHRLQAEQQASGQAALDSAQRVLGEYVLSLEPGFGVGTALDDPLLLWLSRVVHHEINLYWGSTLYASSRRELFTAGLLSKRIPGEIYSRLWLYGDDLAARTARAGAVSYLELFAPFKVPGVGGQERLFLSMPLLAQQEELAEEIASERRRVILVTTFLFVLLMAVGMRLAKNFTRPLTAMVEGTRRIAAGAPTLGVAPDESELAALATAIDRMAAKIAEGRERLMREKQLVERMVEHITAGVVSLDPALGVLMRNRVAADLLGVEPGDRLDEVLVRRPLLAAVRDFVAEPSDGPRQATVALADDSGNDREWTLLWVPLPGGGEPSALLVVEDVSEVVRGQRLQAWAEMARMIAHEIKNPLTPIRLSTEHMREVRRSDPARFDAAFERCTENILRQVEELRQIAGEFSTFSQIPQIDPRPGDLVAAIERVVDSYRAAPGGGPSITLDAPDDTLPARFDERLLARAVRNLIENAIRVSRPGGLIVVRLGSDEEGASIAVLDSGPGVPPELLGRIFEPYFSTHTGGTGLGLPIAHRIAEEHGGSITARNRPDGGLEVVIRLPQR